VKAEMAAEVGSGIRRVFPSLAESVIDDNVDALTRAPTCSGQRYGRTRRIVRLIACDRGI